MSDRLYVLMLCFSAPTVRPGPVPHDRQWADRIIMIKRVLPFVVCADYCVRQSVGLRREVSARSEYKENKPAWFIPPPNPE